MNGDGAFPTQFSGSGHFRSFSSASSAPNLPHGVSHRAFWRLLSVVEHERLDEAEHAVRRLQSSNTGFDLATPAETVALLAQTNQIEKELTFGVGYSECFKGTNLRRTEISVGTWVAQQMAGPVLQTYAIYFFEQAGLPPAQAFNMSLGLVSRQSDRANISTQSRSSAPLSHGHSSTDSGAGPSISPD